MSEKNSVEALDRVCELIYKHLDTGKIADARRRHADMMSGRESDYLPISFSSGVPELKDMPMFSRAEQFEDPAASLYIQLREVLVSLASGGDSVPGVRANTGTCNAMTIMGAEYWVPEDSLPCVNKPVSKEGLKEFELPDDISGLGNMPVVLEHMQFHINALKEHGLSEWINVYHCDQQGPFDIACGARGSDFFLDLYEDPEFAHELMAKSRDVYIALSRLCKKIAGEPIDGGNANGVWSETGGVRMCGDSDILISHDQFRDIVLPYEQEAFAAFGGGWLHYCGGVKGYNRPEGLHLHELYGQIEGLRGLNWTTAGDWLAEIRKLNELGVLHIGRVGREENESLEDHFRRILGAFDKRWGIIFQNPELRPEENSPATVELWRKLQDEHFGNLN